MKDVVLENTLIKSDVHYLYVKSDAKITVNRLLLIIPRGLKMKTKTKNMKQGLRGYLKTEKMKRKGVNMESLRFIYEFMFKKRLVKNEESNMRCNSC